MWRVSLCVSLSLSVVCVWLGGVCVCRVVWHAEKPPYVDSTRLRVYIQYVSVYAGNTRTCISTCARGASTHGDV